jgi:hypothetical protein
MKNYSKNPISLLLALLLVGGSHVKLNAQIRCLGVIHQQSTLKNVVAQNGIEYNSVNYLYNLGVGYSTSTAIDAHEEKLIIHADIHLIPFHHGYLNSRLAPYVGVQVEKSKVQLETEASKNLQINTVLNLNAGLKLSLDRFIVSADYQFAQKLINFRVMYAIWVTNRCVKKRIDEYGNRYGYHGW